MSEIDICLSSILRVGFAAVNCESGCTRYLEVNEMDVKDWNESLIELSCTRIVFSSGPDFFNSVSFNTKRI